MSLTYEVLGAPGRDNALLVTIDSGQRITRLLFDCGANCLGGLPVSHIRAVDALFFSHLHMDHVAGFDDFFRDRYTPEEWLDLRNEAQAIFPATRFPQTWDRILAAHEGA